MENEKTPEKKTSPKKHVKKLVHRVKKSLAMEISLPLGLIILLVIVALIKLPYTAKEVYTETEERIEPVTKTVEDREHPFYERLCKDVPLGIVISDEWVYGKPFGTSGYKCYAEFKVTNKGTADGKWTFTYLFDIGGKKITSEPVTELIPKYTSFTFEFETEQCKEGDKPDGSYLLVSGPVTQTCEYQLTYPNRTITINDTVKVEVQKTRVITKYEPIWQKVIGYNRYEKV